MLADCADAEGLSFPEPSAHARSELKELLPEIATVGNPLDYTTPLWGQEEALEKVLMRRWHPGMTLRLSYRITRLSRSAPTGTTIRLMLGPLSAQHRKPAFPPVCARAFRKILTTPPNPR